MQWLRRLFMRRPRQEPQTAIWLYVACGRCGEPLRVRADRRYDLVSTLLDPGESGAAYTLHKDIVGARCFQRIVVDVEFDRRFQVSAQQISGGRWLTAEDYRVAVGQQAHGDEIGGCG